MTELSWGDISSRRYEAGVDRGVYYGASGIGIAWNGLVSVVEGSDGDADSDIYLDGVRIMNRRRYGVFSGEVECFTYPEDLDIWPPKEFGMSYRVMTGDEYRIHIIYNAKAYIETFKAVSLADNSDPEPIKWKLTTVPIALSGDIRVSHLVIDTKLAREESVTALEDALYGTPTTQPYLPSPAEVEALFDAHAILKVTPLGNGRYQISGPDEAVSDNGDGTFTISCDSVIDLGDGRYKISSY